jgi:hypothetical protein
MKKTYDKPFPDGMVISNSEPYIWNTPNRRTWDVSYKTNNGESTRSLLLTNREADLLACMPHITSVTCKVKKREQLF